MYKAKVKFKTTCIIRLKDENLPVLTTHISVLITVNIKVVKPVSISWALLLLVFLETIIVVVVFSFLDSLHIYVTSIEVLAHGVLIIICTVINLSHL